MKISNSIRELYQSQLELYNLLSIKVNEVFRNLIKPRWHYESRLKTLESFALKLETGRVNVQTNIDDFFACTIVVENMNSITEAENIVRNQFSFQSRRPVCDDFTSKHADSFQFDDLRLYVIWTDGQGEKPSGLNGLLFEVQIKTFLQHAWIIATHDLIYKTNDKDWSKERIAYQIKAMLEHAEISIYQANMLAQSPSLDKINKETKKIKSIIKMINSIWNTNQLPTDVKRLAENIHNLLSNLDISADELTHLIDLETALGKGKHTLNLSPYGVVVQTLFNQALDKIREYLMGRERNFKILIHKDIEVPSDIDISRSLNVINIR